MPLLEGKVAIITGGGRGLGKAFALRYAAEGASLLLPDISLERAEAAAKEIRDGGGRAVAMEADISDEKATRAIAEKVIQEYGRVDVLLNNAALYYGVHGRPWNEWSVEEWDRMFAVNVRGTYLCCKAVGPLMEKQGSGKIINIASDIFKISLGYHLLAYQCSKAAVYTMTQSLARALGPAGVNVNCIGPGFTATEASLLNGEAVFDKTLGTQALKRREEPEDLVGAAVFLASRESDFITGHFLVVDGGTVMV
jgi:3-oxoacyl-[acyl-carrier protein] reductase